MENLIGRAESGYDGEAMARKLIVGVAMSIGITLIAAASASASIVRVAGGELQVQGLPGGEGSNIDVRYRTPEEAGFLGQSARFEVVDEQGALGEPPLCVNLDRLTVTCDARPVTLIGADLSDGDDRLFIDHGPHDEVPAQYPIYAGGGPGSDVLRGARSGDRLLGGLGRDVVAGGAGNDFVSGGPGSDGLIGFEGDDILLGGTGNDALLGMKGRDRMSGGRGNDVLLAGDGFRERTIDCGPGGQQRALLDRRDPRPRRCG
jgi:RTX calcium-binding nonapeptide repeat (4 copies)